MPKLTKYAGQPIRRPGETHGRTYLPSSGGRGFGSAPMPKPWVLDKIADETMSGGYKLSNVCGRCHMVKGATGWCYC